MFNKTTYLFPQPNVTESSWQHFSWLETDELQTSKVWIYTKTANMQTTEFHPSNIPSQI
jgi:hypothetical protein